MLMGRGAFPADDKRSGLSLSARSGDVLGVWIPSPRKCWSRVRPESCWPAWRPLTLRCLGPDITVCERNGGERRIIGTGHSGDP